MLVNWLASPGRGIAGATRTAYYMPCYMSIGQYPVVLAALGANHCVAETCLAVALAHPARVTRAAVAAVAGTQADLRIPAVAVLIASTLVTLGRCLDAHDCIHHVMHGTQSRCLPPASTHSRRLTPCSPHSSHLPILAAMMSLASRYTCFTVALRHGAVINANHAGSG